MNRESQTLLVLVVEDEPDTADSYSMLLRLWGHAVEVARDGPTALQTAVVRQPDAILLDIALSGGMDGWTLAKQLREQAAGKRPFIVVISGYGREGDRLRSAEAGVDLHLLKPANLDELEE